MRVCVCVAKPVAVELRCHATALILVIGKAQFRRAMLSCDSSCQTSSPPWEGGTKVYINGPGHMTKMAAMPIYHGKIFSRTGSPMILKLGI